MEELKKHLKILIDICNEELGKDYITVNLECFISGKKAAYEKVLEIIDEINQ